MRLALLPPAPPAITGVVITFGADTSWRANFCTLQRQQEAVVLVQQGADLLGTVALQAALATQELAPLAVVLAGRGVLLRTLPVDQSGTPSDALAAVATVLPGVNFADFYIHHEPTAAGTHVGLVRKTVVDELLTELLTANLWVTDLRLGPACFATLLPYLPDTERLQPVIVNGFELQLSADSNAIVGWEYAPANTLTPTPFTVGAEKLSSEQGLPYAVALTALIESPLTAKPMAVARVEALASEWGHRQWFLRLRITVPLVILCLLVANFLVSEHLQDAQSLLAGRMGNNQELLQRVRTLQQTVSRKHGFLTTTGWAQPSWNSLCADRLAASVPVGIDLLLVDISPPETPVGGLTLPVNFRNGIVTIKGQCRDAQRLNIWLQHLNKLPWVAAVRDQNFTYDYAGGQGTFTFTLVIKPTQLLSQ